jgi:hypothetical protein
VGRGARAGRAVDFLRGLIGRPSSANPRDGATSDVASAGLLGPRDFAEALWGARPSTERWDVRRAHYVASSLTERMAIPVTDYRNWKPGSDRVLVFEADALKDDPEFELSYISYKNLPPLDSNEQHQEIKARARAAARELGAESDTDSAAYHQAWLQLRTGQPDLRVCEVLVSLEDGYRRFDYGVTGYVPPESPRP